MRISETPGTGSLQACNNPRPCDHPSSHTNFASEPKPAPIFCFRIWRLQHVFFKFSILISLPSFAPLTPFLAFSFIHHSLISDSDGSPRLARRLATQARRRPKRTPLTPMEPQAIAHNTGEERVTVELPEVDCHMRPGMAVPFGKYIWP